MQKNVASQKIILVAYDATTGVPKTGDAANLTAYVSKDSGAPAALADTSAAELDATNAPGCYTFDVAQGESNADMLLFSGKSSTANIKLDPLIVFTRPPNFPATSIDSNGRLDVIKVAGTSQTAGDIIGDTNDIQTRLPAALVGGRMDSSVGAMAANVITAAATAADFGTEIAAAVWDALTSGMATAGSIGKKLADWVVGTIDTYTGNTKQTGDAYAIVNSGTHGNAALKTLIDDIPTNAELTTALGTADDAVLAAIAALNNLSNAQLTSAIAAGDDATLAAIAALNNLSSAQAQTAAAAALAAFGSFGIKKNTAKAAFMFLMTDSTNHVPTAGLTVTATRSLDGAAFASCANSVTEIASGWYKISLAAADLNGDTVALKFTATGADALNIALVTSA